MNFVIQPCHLLLAILAGWVNRRQQEAIDYLRTENAILRELVGKKRILLNDDQRRRLAVKGKILGRKRMLEMGTDARQSRTTFKHWCCGWRGRIQIAAVTASRAHSRIWDTRFRTRRSETS